MFLGKYYRKNIVEPTFSYYYGYWSERFFDMLMMLFDWYTGDPVLSKEIEQRLLIQGKCAIVMANNKLIAADAHLFGITEYHDEFTKANVSTPIWSRQFTIGKDVVIIENDSLRNGCLHLIEHYAGLVAHTEMSIISALLNVRDSGGVPVAATEKQKTSIHDYQRKIYERGYGVVSDVGGLGVDYVGTTRSTYQSVKDLLETRSKLIKAFYAEIGVKASFEKNNNAVSDEVTSDLSLLEFDLSGMEKCRISGCEAVNLLFNVNWTVEKTKSIDYDRRPEYETSE